MPYDINVESELNIKARREASEMLFKEDLHSVIRVFIMLVAVGYAAGVFAELSDATGHLRFYVETSSGEPLKDAVITLTEGEHEIEPPVHTHIMDQIHSQFVPHVLAIRAGDLVEFPNSDNIRHHVYSFSEAKPFEIRLYANKPEAPVNFATPGLVVLGCNIHDQMLGYIYVSAKSDLSVVTDERGYASVNTTGSVTGVSLWHERLSVDESFQKVLNLQEIRALRNKEGVYVITVDPEIPASVHTHRATPDPSPGFGNSMRR